MELIASHYRTIKKIFRDAFNSSFHYAIATVNKDGSPHVTPIGSLILLDHRRGFYFEEYAGTLSRNLEHNKRVCVMAVNTSKYAMLKALLFGKAFTPPGIRLMGFAGEKRPATAGEIELFQRRVRKYRMLKGHRLLWSRLRYVREITFDSCEPVRIGALTQAVWNEFKDTEGT